MGKFEKFKEILASDQIFTGISKVVNLSKEIEKTLEEWDKMMKSPADPKEFDDVLKLRNKLIELLKLDKKISNKHRVEWKITDKNIVTFWDYLLYGEKKGVEL